MKDNLHLTKNQFQLLSAYADGQLAGKDLRKAETLLSTNPQAVKALEDLRKLKSLLRRLPERKIPHSFILTRREAESARPGWLVNGLRALSGISAAALAAVLAFDLLMPRMALPQGALAEEAMVMEEAPAIESMAMEEAEATEEESLQVEPAEGPIISFQPFPEARGLGGGGGSPGDAPAAIPGRILPDISINQGDEIPDVVGQPMAEEAMEAMQADEAMEKGSMDSGPILGVRPEEQQGQITYEEIPSSIEQVYPPRQPDRLSYLAIEIILLALAVLSLLVSVAIRRQTAGRP